MRYLPFIQQKEHCSHTTAINLQSSEKASFSSSRNSAKLVPCKLIPYLSSLIHYSPSHFSPPSLPVTVPVLIKGSPRICIVSIVNEWLVVLCVRGDTLAACLAFVSTDFHFKVPHKSLSHVALALFQSQTTWFHFTVGSGVLQYSEKNKFLTHTICLIRTQW